MSKNSLTQKQLVYFLEVEWDFIRKSSNGHYIYKHKVTRYTVTLSFHRPNGKPVSHFDLRTIANYYKNVLGYEGLSKPKLVKEILDYWKTNIYKLNDYGNIVAENESDANVDLA